MSIRLHQMIGGLVARLDFALVVLEQHMPTPWLADLAERLTEARAEIACDYLHCGEPGGCPAHSGNGHLEDFAGQLWVCDRCGFSFDARHTSSDGALHGTAHYCPVCSEAHLERIGFAMSAELDDLRAQLRDSARAIQEGIDLIGKLAAEKTHIDPGNVFSAELDAYRELARDLAKAIACGLCCDGEDVMTSKEGRAMVERARSTLGGLG